MSPHRFQCSAKSRVFGASVSLAAHAGLLLWVLSISATRVLPVVEIAPTRASLMATFVMPDQHASATAPTAFYSEIELDTPKFVLPMPTLPEIDAVASDSFEKARPAMTAADVADIGRLQGIYLGQITLRVTRLLEDSRRLAREGAEPCVLHIIQDERGQVLDVTTEECEFDTVWRREIVAAVFAASPLPLPPQGLAMGSYLSIDVSSL